MSERSPLLAAEALTKRYGGVSALAGVSLALHRGAVHALLGANGAGKSTLVKILSGNVQPDGGAVALDGSPVHLFSPAAALAAGIATVHQELSLFPGLTVAQNISIGRERRRWGWIDERHSLGRAQTLLDRLGIATIRPQAAVGTLSLAEAQLVEIAKAMSLDPRVLILDEPTSSLGQADTERLLGIVRALRAGGCAIVFISHRMGEIEAVADDVTILRGGRVVAAMTRARFGRQAALELMLGQAPADGRAATHPVRPGPAGPPLLRVDALSLPGRLDRVGLAVRPGEIVGLAGLEGQGQKDLLFALFGLFRHGLTGRVTVADRPALVASPRDAIAAGFALIPDDRKALGGFGELSVRHNIALPSLSRPRRFGPVDRAAERGTVDGLVERLGIKCGSPDAPLGSLSGGNQQKVVTAKWLAHGAEVWLFCDPTRGVDAGAREAIYRTVRELAASGKAVLVYSTDIEEFAVLCGRVLVFRGGRVAGELTGPAIAEDAILALSFADRHAA